MMRPLFKHASRRPQLSAAALLTLLALGGCAVGPDFERPETALPAAYATIATAPAEEVRATEWWRLFQDAQLNALVELALSANQDVLAAVARVEEAEGLAREAGATFFPQIDLNSTGARSQVSTRNATPLPSTAPRLQDSRNAALATSFELDLWGKLRRANEAARAQLLSSRYASDTVNLSVAGMVASGYLALRAADANIALTADTLDSRRKALDIVKSRQAGGAASPLDLYQAQSVLAAAEAQLADLRRQRALAESQLALLTGKPGLKIAAGDLRQLPLPPVPPAGLPSTLLDARPDIRSAEETLVSANARIGVAKAALFPMLSLTGSAGSSSAALANLFSASAATWSLGLAATMPIFDAGRNFARIDQASARQKQALASYQKTVQTAFKEVNDALVGLDETAVGEQAQAVRVQATQKTLALAQIRYQAGYSAFMEVLDAQRSANEAQLAHVGIRQARLNAAVDLFKALGGGWKDDFKADSLNNTGAKEVAAAGVQSTPAR